MIDLKELYLVGGKAAWMTYLYLVEEKNKKVKELQDNITAVNFTPQSKIGKMLMAKCRTLHEENEEIRNQVKEGKVVNDFLDERSV